VRQLLREGEKEQDARNENQHDRYAVRDFIGGARIYR
jgi:hypothetical protein